LRFGFGIWISGLSSGPVSQPRRLAQQRVRSRQPVIVVAGHLPSWRSGEARQPGARLWHVGPAAPGSCQQGLLRSPNSPGRGVRPEARPPNAGEENSASSSSGPCRNAPSLSLRGHHPGRGHGRRKTRRSRGVEALHGWVRASLVNQLGSPLGRGAVLLRAPQAARCAGRCRFHTRNRRPPHLVTRLARTQPVEGPPHLLNGGFYADHVLDLGDGPE